MRIIIAGSRNLGGEKEYKLLANYMAANIDLNSVECVVCGCAKGADQLGARWAESLGIKVVRRPAKWTDLTAYPCIKAEGSMGVYNKLAGLNRNAEMAKYASQSDGVLIALWDGKSGGTNHMISQAKKYGLRVHIINPNEKEVKMGQYKITAPQYVVAANKVDAMEKAVAAMSVIEVRNAIDIYVDGTYRDGKCIGGYIVVIGDVEVARGYGFVNNEEYAKTLNVAAECKAAILAVQYAKTHKYDKLVIYHDYTGLAAWATGAWKAKKSVTVAYKQFMVEAMKTIDIEFVHVKGHTGNKYNTLVDEYIAEVALI